MSLRELYGHVDDFWQECAPVWRRQRTSGARQRERAGRRSESEVMTLLILFHTMTILILFHTMMILILFHSVRSRDCTTYDTRHVQVYWRREFPALVRYTRFIESVPRVLVPLCASLQTGLGPCSGLSCVDSTARAVCHTRRIHAPRTVRGWAARGKASMGWFYGFTRHLVVTERGDLLAWRRTPGHVADRAPSSYPRARPRALWHPLRRQGLPLAVELPRLSGEYSASAKSSSFL